MKGHYLPLLCGLHHDSPDHTQAPTHEPALVMGFTLYVLGCRSVWGSRFSGNELILEDLSIK